MPNLKNFMITPLHSVNVIDQKFGKPVLSSAPKNMIICQSAKKCIQLQKHCFKKQIDFKINPRITPPKRIPTESISYLVNCVLVNIARGSKWVNQIAPGSDFGCKGIHTKVLFIFMPSFSNGHDTWEEQLWQGWH